MTKQILPKDAAIVAQHLEMAPNGHSNGHSQHNGARGYPDAKNGGVWDFLTATRNDATFRGIRDDFPDFDLEAIRGADGPARLIWRLRAQFDVSAVQEGKPLDDVVSNALHALGAVDADAREALAWLSNSAAKTYKLSEAPRVARRLVENWQRAPRFELFTFEDMALLPRPRWLVRGLLVECTVSTLSADSGGFKSFLALEVALCIATGTPCFGREVRQGTAVYVAAEGFYTILERARAWSQVRGIPLPRNFHILRVPVNVADTLALQEFARTVEGFEPVFVALDTLSQNAVGLNENSNDEMALFMAGMARLGTQTGAHVMAVHHNAKASGAFRGAGAIKANVDTHITLERPEGDSKNTVFVRCEKQRGKPFESFTLRGQEVEIEGMADEYGDPVTSLVFELCDEAVPAKKHPATKRAETTSAKLLDAFDELASENDGVKVGTWAARTITTEENPDGICKERTFWSYLQKFKGEDEKQTPPEIEECGFHKNSELFRRVSATARTARTANGSECSDAHNPVSATARTATTPLGVAVVAVPLDGKGKTDKTARAKRGAAAADSEPYTTTKPKAEVSA